MSSTLTELENQIAETFNRIERKEIEFLQKPVEQHIKEILETTTNLTDEQIDRCKADIWRQARCNV